MIVKKFKGYGNYSRDTGVIKDVGDGLQVSLECNTVVNNH